MKYIDSNKLKAKVKELNLTSKTYEEQVAFYSALEMVVEIIDSLQQEQPEVDLEKALNGLDNAYFDLDGIAVMGATYYLTVNDLKDIARDFYELGKNSK